LNTKLIEITVSAETGTGKSEVTEVIERALRDFYGNNVQIASYDMQLERNSSGKNLIENAKNTGQTVNIKNSVFVIKEHNQAKGGDV